MPFTSCCSINGNTALGYKRVGVNNSSPKVLPNSGIFVSIDNCLWSNTILRTKEKPLECTPDDGRPKITSPALILSPVINLGRSTIPTAKPATS